jgi:glycine hydroxymethyltransferase
MVKNPLIDYIKNTPADKINTAFTAYLANLTKVAEVSPEIAASIVKELNDQRSHLKLIASENYSSISTQSAMGNLLTDKYAEGYPFHRFYAGCDNIDNIESYAAQQACKLFGSDYAYVQPHSGASANLIAFWAILTQKVQNPELEKSGETNLSNLSREQWDNIRKLSGNQRLLGLDYYSGGHLTHGYRFNVSAQMFDVYTYTVDKETRLLDYDAIEKTAMEVKPLILLAGYSAYPGKINFRRMKEIADKAGAVFMVDMAHFAGLVAGKVYDGDYNPVPFADVVTTTSHKTLRGPRGGLILCKEAFAEAVNKGCPMVIGGPLPHMMAAKAIALTEANRPEFADYAKKILENAKALGEACVAEGMTISSGKTENHLILIDVRGFNLTGRQAESALRECGITLNRNALPFDTNGPWYTSGLRLGTPAVTTLGMGKEEMKEIAAIIKTVLSSTTADGPKDKLSKAKYTITDEGRKAAQDRVAKLIGRYPVYPELDLEYLNKAFSI